MPDPADRHCRRRCGGQRIDPGRFRGTYYRAANCKLLGMTTGRARQVKIAHEKLNHGDRSPECGQGHVYEQKKPRVLVHSIVGQAPVAARCTRSRAAL